MRAARFGRREQPSRHHTVSDARRCLQPCLGDIYTTQAVEFARSVERVVLVDGVRPAELMIDFEVGVTMRPIRVPKLDSDDFDEQ